jgi:ATP-dependent DNA ligase
LLFQPVARFPVNPRLYMPRIEQLTSNDAREATMPDAQWMGLEGIVSKRKGSAYRSGRSADWLKMKNPEASAVKREAEEDRGR